MFNINHIHNKKLATNYIELKDSNRNSYAKILLNSGGSLQKLSLNNNSIIKDLEPLSYDSTFASAILFPFTNRLENGAYNFKEKNYTLDLNLKEENNAIHGLIYNKVFTLTDQETTEGFAKITLRYIETQKTKGFPHHYTILLTYILTADAISIYVTIKNDGKNTFPFNVGWHPYFYSSNLFDSILSLESDKKLVLNKDMIPVKIKAVSTPNHIQIKNKSFDDCYILNTKSVGFKTPDYSIMISSSSEENYLQVFRPDKANTIAIEPKTGPANSFNNKIGLQVLEPNATHQVVWKVKLKDNA